MQIKDKNGVENVVANLLSRLTIAQNTHSPPINDEFPEESLMQLENAPRYAHIANFLATGETPDDRKEQDRSISWRRSIPIIGKNLSCLNTVQIR